MSSPTNDIAGFWRWWPLRLVVFALVPPAAIFLFDYVLRPLKFDRLSGEAISILIAIASAILSLVLYRMLVWATERRSPGELQFRRAVPELAGGLALGAACALVAFAIAGLLGRAVWDRAFWMSGMTTLIALSLAAAIVEELVLRGAVLRLVEEGTGTLIAWIVSSAILVALFLAFGRDCIPVLQSGLMLGAAYAWTRSLWFSIGLHVSWNLLESRIIPLDGGAFHIGTLNDERITLAVCIVAATVMLLLASHRGEWRGVTLRLR